MVVFVQSLPVAVWLAILYVWFAVTVYDV